jgi:transcriptional regulator of arginine metabolism
MHKHARHAAIREIVREQRFANQEELREALARRDFDVTQATLSRDIRELRLIKVP